MLGREEECVIRKERLKKLTVVHYLDGVVSFKLFISKLHFELNILILFFPNIFLLNRNLRRHFSLLKILENHAKNKTDLLL